METFDRKNWFEQVDDYRKARRAMKIGVRLIHVPQNRGERWEIGIFPKNMPGLKMPVGRGVHKKRLIALRDACRAAIAWQLDSHRRGFENEQRYIELLKNKRDQLPPWVIDSRKATRHEDQTGVDAVVMSDVGELLLQVKSSLAGKIRFNKKERYKDIGTIVINPNITDDDAIRQTILELNKLRAVKFIPT